MKRNPLIKRIPLLLIGLLLIWGIRYCWVSFPIACGYAAKVLCSAVFVSGRKEKDVKAEDLNFFPVNRTACTVNYQDSSVTVSLFGLAKRKAIYRKGLGATLISELSEKEVRGQQFTLAIPPVLNSDTISWPLGDRLPDSLPAHINKRQLQQAVENLFREQDTTHLNRTRALVVVYKGQIIAEQYASGFTKNTRLIGWSMTKSITNALIGLLVKENKLQVDQPAPVPEWSRADDPRHAITLKDLLQQSSGLAFVEEYAKSSDATKMLFQRADMGKYTASHPLKDNPGTVFQYSSGNTNILSRIIRQTVGDENYTSFPYQQLFYKLGMYNTVLEPDASGTFVGSSYSYATARDWARFGLLYLNKGQYHGEQILPEDWITKTVTPASSAAKGQYGFQFWLNAGAKNNPADRLYPSLPADLFCADGFEGQNIFIIPSRQLVVVRLGLTRNGRYGAEEFLSAVIKAVE